MAGGLGGGWQTNGGGGGGGGSPVTTAGGTPNHLAKFITPTSIGDSSMTDNGVNVFSAENIIFSNGLGIDVVATGGTDVLSVGVNNADTINYGYSGTTHNFIGTTINQNVTNLNIKDKLITINDGGGAASGGSSGFEIEEAGIATGYFIQNSTRNGFDFQASAITGVATLSLVNLTANRTLTVQNASGTIAYLSDITGLNAFVQNGNSFAATARLGTNDAFALEFETNNTLAATFDTSQNFGIGVVPLSKLHVGGAARFGIASSTTGSLIFQNAINANTLTIQSGITSASYSVTLPTAQGAASTFLQNDGAGVLSWTSASSVSWALNGNTVGAEKTLGTIDAFALPFITTNIERGRISSGGLWSINSATVAGTQFYVKGSGTTSATYTAQFFNSTPAVIMVLRDDIRMGVGTASPNNTIQVADLINFDNAVISTSLGFQAGNVNVGTQNVFVGYRAGLANTSGSNNTGIGFEANITNITGSDNTCVGNMAFFSGKGSDNTAIGYESQQNSNNGVSNTSVGAQSLQNIGNGSANTAIGNNSGDNCTGESNGFFGRFAGHLQTSRDNTFWFDGRPRGSAAIELTDVPFWFVHDASVANQTIRMNANVGINTTQSALLTIAAGTATAGTAPLKFTPGTLLATPEIGAMEFVDDGTTGHLYITVHVATVTTRVTIV